jgi:anti-sigma-K factor RskA
MTNLHDQAYPYVVGALPSTEAAEYEEHVANCDRCPSEIRTLHEVTAELSMVAAAAPPPGLRSAVLTAISDAPQLAATPRSVPGQRLTSPSEGRSSQRSRATVTPLHRAAPKRWPALLAAAAVFAVLGFGGWAWQARQAAQRDAQQATQQAAQLTELLSARDVKTVTGRGVASGMTGTVVLSPSRRQAVLVASHLPELPDGKVYEAWTIKKAPAPAGTFTAAEAKRLVALPRSALRAQSVAITVEPKGGSAQPTSDAIFTVNIPHPA